MRIAATVGLLLGACALVGCGDDKADARANTDASAGDAGAPPSACHLDIPQFQTGPKDGLLAIGKHHQIQARVLDADHTPPHRYYNTWTVQLMDADGAVLDDASVNSACATMPMPHTHANPPRNVVKQDEPGTFELDRLNLFMSGNWFIQLAVSSASAAQDAGTADAANVEYTACDPDVPSHAGTDLIVFTVCEPD